ncbi:MAG: CoA-binding protein [Thermodesulfobacteriota bacterium]
MKVAFNKLERAFNPRVVAVVGDSKGNNFNWLKAQKTLKGKLYSVHVNPKSFEDIKALGIENYPSLLDIPEAVDLAIVAVPRNTAPVVLDDCINKEVAAAHFFSAGFSETGTEEGNTLERRLVKKAEKAGFHLIGPNCMGLFNPMAGIRQSEEQYTGVSGPIGFITQSGSIAIGFSLDAHLQGLNINKSVSFGNGIVVDSPDFLEYFGQDKEIKAIGMYLEGVKNGRRFLSVLKEVAAQKPVVIWKGGRTEDGGRATASHTGSLATSQALWEAIVHQSGAIQVAGLEELIDTLKALTFLPPVYGERVAIAGGPGGQSVTATDIFAEAGLKVPPLTQASYDELETFFGPVGGSYRNPIDSAGPVRRDMKRVMQIVARDPHIDTLVYFVSTKPGWHLHPEQLRGGMEILDQVRKINPKPLMVVSLFHNPEAEKETREVMEKIQGLGIPVFPSFERCALALKNSFNYHRLAVGRKR